jgi:hypothetical protein
MQIVTTKISAISTHGDNPVFGESVTHIELCDDGAGLFISLEQVNDQVSTGKIFFNDAAEIFEIAEVSAKMLKDAEKAINGDDVLYE